MPEPIQDPARSARSRRWRIGPVTRYGVIPLILLTLGIRIGMFFRAGPGQAPEDNPAQIPSQTPAATPAPAPETPADAEASQAVELEVSGSFQNNLYPSLLLSFGGSYPEYARFLRIAVRGAPAGRPCLLRIESSLFLQPLEVPFTASAEILTASPELPWNFAALRKISQDRPESFVATLTSDNRTLGQKTQVCMVHSINQAVTRIYDEDSGQWQDTSVCFAAFVNEDHPWINGLLQEAMARGGIPGFTGYQSGGAPVIAQLQAVWAALAARGLRYVNVSTDSSTIPGIGTQYVRFLDQSVKDQGANCVDASVLFASLFQRIGLRSVLVLRPGHCFVAVYDASDGDRLIPIETTLLTADTFASALAAGQQELKDVLPEVGTPNYSIVDIADARRLGIKAIAFEP